MIVQGRHSRTINTGTVETRYYQTCEKGRPFALVLRYSVVSFFWVLNWVTSVPADIYNNYSRLIDEHNKLVTESNSAVAQRTALVATCNSNTKLYNDELQQSDDPKSKWGSACD